MRARASRVGGVIALAGAAAAGVGCAACESSPSGPRVEPATSAPPSPNASILPAALGSSLAGPRVALDAGRPPAELSGRAVADAAPPPTPLTEGDVGRDRGPPRESTWLTLALTLAWNGEVPAPHGAEVSREGYRRAAEATRHKVTVDLLPSGRMRWVFMSPTFPLPAGTELRSRTEHYGHVLVWPDGSAQRVVSPGALRAVLSERRADVMPLAPPTVGPRAERAAGAQPSVRQVVSTEVGQLDLEQTRLAGAGVAGALLCRLLLELIGADPSSAVCQDELTPSRARVASPGGGVLELVVAGVERRTDASATSPFSRPLTAPVRRGGLPPASGEILDRPALAALRTRAVEGEVALGAPAEGVVVVNRTDLVQYVLLDGLAVAWIPPRGERHLVGLQAGVYDLAHRDLLGIEVAPPAPTRIPARIVIGDAADAGAAPPP
ncbi:MAG: hypothetical protein IT376_17845 [Polyangiaceae bacterium]|nr:hypothetical protein [Polyangiaceae bacterium]